MRLTETLFQWINRISLTAYCCRVAAFSFLNAALAFATPYTITNLGPLGGSVSEGQGINASGEVAGGGCTAGNASTHAFLFTSGSIQDLGALGGLNCIAYGANAKRQVTGYAYSVGDASFREILFTGGSMQDPMSLGGPAFGYGIYGGGQVIGYSDTAVGCTHAFLYKGGSMQDLGTLDGSSSSSYGTNASGRVAGYSDASYAADPQACVYDIVHGMVDLTRLIDPLSGWRLSRRLGIKTVSHITGWGRINAAIRTRFCSPPLPRSPPPRAAAIYRSSPACRR